MIFPIWYPGKDYFLLDFLGLFYYVGFYLNLGTPLKSWIRNYFWRTFGYFFLYWSFHKDTENYFLVTKVLVDYLRMKKKKKRRNPSLIISLIFKIISFHVITQTDF